MLRRLGFTVIAFLASRFRISGVFPGPECRTVFGHTDIPNEYNPGSR